MTQLAEEYVMPYQQIIFLFFLQNVEKYLVSTQMRTEQIVELSEPDGQGELNYNPLSFVLLAEQQLFGRAGRAKIIASRFNHPIVWPLGNSGQHIYGTPTAAELNCFNNPQAEHLIEEALLPCDFVGQPTADQWNHLSVQDMHIASPAILVANLLRFYDPHYAKHGTAKRGKRCPPLADADGTPFSGTDGIPEIGKYFDENGLAFWNDDSRVYWTIYNRDNSGALRRAVDEDGDVVRKVWPARSCSRE